MTVPKRKPRSASFVFGLVTVQSLCFAFLSSASPTPSAFVEQSVGLLQTLGFVKRGETLPEQMYTVRVSGTY